LVALSRGHTAKLPLTARPDRVQLVIYQLPQLVSNAQNGRETVLSFRVFREVLILVRLPKEQRAKIGRPKKPEGALTRVEIQRRYEQRQRERRAYMERITIAAEALNAVLNNADGEPLEIPLSVVSTDPAETLENIAVCASQQIARRRAQSVHKQEVTQSQ